MTKVFLIILFLLGTVITGLFYLSPAWDEFQAIRQRNKHLEEISAELDDLIKNRDELVGLINRISKEDLRRIDQAIPVGQKAGDLVIMLENAAIKNGIFLKNIELTSSVQKPAQGTGRTPSPAAIYSAAPVSPDAVSEFPVSIQISGGYEAFKAFIEDLEKNLRIINVKTLTFSSPSENKPEFSVNMSVITYHQ